MQESNSWSGTVTEARCDEPAATLSARVFESSARVRASAADGVGCFGALPLGPMLDAAVGFRRRPELPFETGNFSRIHEHAGERSFFEFLHRKDERGAPECYESSLPASNCHLMRSPFTITHRSAGLIRPWPNSFGILRDPIGSGILSCHCEMAGSIRPSYKMRKV